MSSKIQIGIVGAGYISQKHLEVLKNSKNFEIAAITSRTLKKAKLVAKKFK